MKLRQRLLLVLSLPVLMLGYAAAPVLAATQAPAQPAGQGLEISPLRIERNVDPGQTVEFDIRLRNITKATSITTASIEDFEAQEEGGQPKLLLSQNGKSAEPSPYTFKPWVRSITSLTLVPQEAKNSHIVIKVPTNASPGSHFGVIRFTATAPGVEGTGVSLTPSIGTLVFLRVSGNVVTKASIIELSALQNGQKKDFFEKGPIDFLLRIRNKGNVHIKPSGTLRVTNTFGNETAVLSVNKNAGSILPQSVRRFAERLNKSSLFGRYKTEANIQYEGKNLSRTLTFWVIPYKLIAILLGILILLIIGLRSGMKKYNRHIINKANKG